MCFFNRKESRVRYKSNFGLKIVLSLLLAVEIFVIYAVQITDTIFYSCSSMTDVQNYLFFALVEASPYLFFVGIMYCALLLMTIFFVWREHTKNLFCYLSLVAFSVYDVISYRFFYSESRGFYKNEGFGVALQLGIVVLAVVFAIVCKNKNKTIEENPVSSEERALSFTVLAQVVLSVVQCVLRSVLKVDLLFGNYTLTKSFDLLSTFFENKELSSFQGIPYLLPYLLILVFCAVSIYRGKTETVGLGACAYALEIAAICISLYADIFGVNAAAGFAFRWELIPHLLSDAAVFAFLIRYLIKKRRERKAVADGQS